MKRLQILIVCLYSQVIEGGGTLTTSKLIINKVIIINSVLNLQTCKSIYHLEHLLSFLIVYNLHLYYGTFYFSTFNYIYFSFVRRICSLNSQHDQWSKQTLRMFMTDYIIRYHNETMTFLKFMLLMNFPSFENL